MKSFQGQTQITDEGIKKHFKNFDAADAIYELIWNGFDANAKTVVIKTSFTEMDGLASIEIIDDGDGIDIENLKNSFEKFNESTKKNLITLDSQPEYYT